MLAAKALETGLCCQIHIRANSLSSTEKDPYSVRKGLLYSHIGWMVMKQNPKRIGRTDISDLNDDPIVVWQHKNCKLASVTNF